MSIPDRMTYERAFFLNEERGEPTPFDAAFVLEATCFHEAGHAVAGYMLGFGLSSVSVTVECARLPENPEKLGFPGLYMQAKRPTARWGRAIRERGYGHAALAFGCMTCAGPAAELRFLTYNDMPRQMLGATIGDHEAVDRIGKYLDNGGNGRFRPRDRFAFRRLSWREAQKLIHREDVWDAVGELAYALQERGSMTGPKRPDKRPASSRVRLRARSFGGPASRRSAKSSPGADPTDLGAASNLPTETRATLFSP